MEIETELGIPLQELAIELIPPKQKQEAIIDLLDNHSTKVESSVLKMVKDYIKESKVNVTVINVEFTQMDSDNLNHGAAYFSVKLKGIKTELKKIADNDLLFVYDWENPTIEGLAKNSKHNLTLPNTISMLDGNNKNDMKKATNKGKQTIKMVADINDPYTQSVIKNIWDSADNKKRTEILDKQGYSHKFIKCDFEELTPAVQELIITDQKEEVNVNIKSSDWTEPEWLNQADWHNLKIIKNYVDEGDFKSAMDHARDCDTVIREEIPGDIWKKMGGQLTKTGEDKLKAIQKNKSKYDDRNDDLNPRYMFSTTATQLLSEALKGDFDITYLLKKELANRGLDINGKWVGFDKAKEIHKV